MIHKQSINCICIATQEAHSATGTTEGPTENSLHAAPLLLGCAPFFFFLI